MKLNLDCIRDILLIVEEEQTIQKINNPLLADEGFSDTWLIKQISSDWLIKHEKLKEYDTEDILYSIKQMDESGFLEISDIKPGGYFSYLIEDISPKGHEFISNLKSLTVWNKVKSTIKSVSGASLSIVSKVAAETVLKQLLP